MSSGPLDEIRLGQVLLSSEPAKTARAARCYQLRSFGPPGGPQDDKCRAGVWMKSDSGGPVRRGRRHPGLVRIDSVSIAYVRDYFRRKA
jgi:hypothetical protein